MEIIKFITEPRSIAESIGLEFKRTHSDNITLNAANKFLKSLQTSDWEKLKPKSATMSGDDYQNVWKR